MNEKMGFVSKLRETLRPLVDEPEDDSDVDLRVWPFFLWVFLIAVVNICLGEIVSGEYREVILWLGIVVTGALLFKPMLKLSVKKKS